MQAASFYNDVQSTLPSGVVRVIHQYSAEYPDDPRVMRTIHVLTNGEEKVVFEDPATQAVNLNAPLHLLPRR